MNGHLETIIAEQGTAEQKSNEFGNNDPKLKSCSSTVEHGDLDAFLLTPKNCGTPTALEFTMGSIHCSAVSENSEGIGKSTCSLTFHESSVPKSEVSREEDISILKDDGRNGDNASESNAEHKEEKNANLRPRRKSKYLSPPFVGPKGERSKKSGDKSTKDSGKPSLVKSARKRKQPIKPIAVSVNIEDIKASSAELILQLNTLASNPCYNKSFDPAKVFFNSFRASAFRGVSIEEQTRIDKTYSQKKVRTLKQKKAPSSDLCDGNSNVASSSPLKLDPLSSNIKPKSKRKRKVEQTANLESDKNQTTQIPDLNCVTGAPSATIDPLQVTEQGEAKNVPEKKKRIRKKKIPQPISIEASLKDAGSYASSASTVVNSNVGSPPGFCSKGLTPNKPTLTPKLEPHTENKSSSGLTLDQMKQSLEFMTSMLEKSGDMISPVMRANLEKEIKNLLKKVDPMISSSS